MNGHGANARVLSPSAEKPDSLASAAAGARANALASRLGQVLSASYSDLDFRDTLAYLDERGIENSARTKRQLRLDVQREVIECNGAVINDFGKVAEQLKRVGSAIEMLNAQCGEMRQHMTAVQKATAPMLEEAAAFMKQEKETATKQKLLKAFTEHFTISSDDMTSLTSSAEPVNDQFFGLLARTKEIHRDCQVLLGEENQSLGIDLMEQSSKNLNAAYQKLFRWVQAEFQTLNLENPQMSTSIRRALRVLAERPNLFQACLDFFAETRENILSDSFHAALTGSSTGASDQPFSKPIEFFAHDSLRYVGDMLAWVHSATVSEREALESLFISEGDEIAKSIQAGLESDPWSRTQDGQLVFDGQKALIQLVNSNIAGVDRMLRQRIAQTVQSIETPTTAFLIANLLGFYETTFNKLLGEDAELLRILSDLRHSAFEQFKTSMQDRAISVQNDPPAPAEDLRAPNFYFEILEQLRVLLESYDSSLTPVSRKESDFEPIVQEALDPFLDVCAKMAAEIAQPHSAIFLLNCLCGAKAILARFSFTASRTLELEKQITEEAKQLVESQHTWFLLSSGLHPLITSLNNLPDTEDSLRSILSLVQFTPQALREASQALDDFLPSALMDAMENLKPLQDGKLSRGVTEDAAMRFCRDFEFIEAKIEALDQLQQEDTVAKEETAEPTERNSLRAVFPRTTGEIRVLLS